MFSWCRLLLLFQCLLPLSALTGNVTESPKETSRQEYNTRMFEDAKRYAELVDQLTMEMETPPKQKSSTCQLLWSNYFMSKSSVKQSIKKQEKKSVCPAGDGMTKSTRAFRVFGFCVAFLQWPASILFCCCIQAAHQLHENWTEKLSWESILGSKLYHGLARCILKVVEREGSHR